MASPNSAEMARSGFRVSAEVTRRVLYNIYQQNGDHCLLIQLAPDRQLF